MKTWAILAMAAVLSGCGEGDGWWRPEPDEPEIAARIEPLQASHVQVQVEALGEVPNSGLLLPQPSPDGTRIAVLRIESDVPVSLDALFTGRGVGDISLQVARVDSPAEATPVCQGGAAWPSWSANGSKLVFVFRDAEGRCALGIHNVAEGTTRRVEPGLRWAMMPTLSPDGRFLAYVTPADRTGPSRLWVYDLSETEATACPAGSPSERHLWPAWTPDGRLVYLRESAGKAELAQWGPGRFAPERIADVHLSASLAGAFQARAGVPSPISGDGLQYACYDTSADRIVLVHLREGTRRELREGTRAGCWLGARTFVAATDKELLAFPPSGASSLLMRGAWLPLGSTGGKQVLTCAPGKYAGVLDLSRMRVVLSPTSTPTAGG